MRKKSGVGSGTGPLTETAHTVTPQFTGDDIAMGITCQVQIGDRRSIIFQTHVAQSSKPAEINTLLDKVWTAMDRIAARYRLKELQLNKKMQQNQMGLVLDNNATTKAKWEADWQKENRGRRGPFVPNANQINMSNQQTQMIERHKQEIASIEAEISETERLIATG